MINNSTNSSENGLAIWASSIEKYIINISIKLMFGLSFKILIWFFILSLRLIIMIFSENQKTKSNGNNYL